MRYDFDGSRDPGISIAALEKYGVDVTLCPKCKTGHLLLVAVVFPMNRGSPKNLKNANADETTKR